MSEKKSLLQALYCISGHRGRRLSVVSGFYQIRIETLADSGRYIVHFVVRLT